MTTEIKLPQWGMSMSEGTIVRWMVGVGDKVAKDQPLVEIEAAKVIEVIQSPVDGFVQELLVDVDDTVEVNTVLCVLGDEAPSTSSLDGDTPESKAAAESAPAAKQEPAQPDSDDSTVTHPVSRDVEAARMNSGRVHGVVPLARKLAKEHDIDLTQLTGSGTQGRIVVKDVEAAIAERDETPQAQTKAAPRPQSSQVAPTAAAVAQHEGETREPASRMRQVIAERMHGSVQDTAQFTMTTTADVTDFAALRSDVGGGATKPSYMDAVVRAVALALQNHPMLNSRLEGDTIINPGAINVGFAVAIEEGLVVPVVHRTDELGLAEIADATRDLAQRARTNELGADAFDAGTFSVTGLGGQGVDFFSPIINPPQSAILGIGRVREFPARFGTGFLWRQELPLSLTVDHRLNDGYPSALFLAEVVDLLEHPKQLI